MNQPTEKNRPIHKIRIGNVEAAIWRRTKESGNHFHTATFQRSYRTKDGKYRSVSDFNPQELLVLVEVARLASEWIRKVEVDEPEAVNA